MVVINPYMRHRESATPTRHRWRLLVIYFVPTWLPEKLYCSVPRSSRATYLAAILFSDNRKCPSSSTCTKFTKYSNVLLLILYERISGRVVFLFLNINFSAGWLLRIAFQINDHFLTSSPIHAFEDVLPFESRVRNIVLLIEESCSQSLLQKIPIKSIRSFPGNQPLIFGQLWTLIVDHTSQIFFVFWNRISGSSYLSSFSWSGIEPFCYGKKAKESEWITFQALAQYQKRRKRNACGMDIAYLFLYSSGIKHIKFSLQLE